MSRSASPLRYPGGKSCLFELATSILRLNGLQQHNYAEPYSGGCGLALSLLFAGHVSQVHLNDLDRSVWAFWQSVIGHNEELVCRIINAVMTVDEWEKQRAVQLNKANAEVVDLGFSTFYLNRTNRSGIIHSAGIIGGKGQSGMWKLDCRFNKPDLVERVQRVERYKNRINLYNEDAEIFMERLGGSIPAKTVAYIDPPYFEKGSLLYRNAYRPEDHQRIASRLASLNTPWFLTYDNVSTIRELYRDFYSIDLDIGYSVQTKRRGAEILVVSDGLKLPIEDRTSTRGKSAMFPVL